MGATASGERWTAVSVFDTAVAVGGDSSGGRENGVSLGLEPGRRLGRFKRLGERLALKGLGDRLVDIGEVEDEGAWIGFGAMMLMSSSSTLCSPLGEEVKTSAAESSTDGTECSRLSELWPRAVLWGSGWLWGGDIVIGSMSRSKMADEPECLWAG